MPKLVKIESDSAVSNYTPASGHVTAFLAEDNGDIKIKVKKSDGTIAELSGGSGGAFDLVKVESYTPAYDSINSLALSGLTDHSGDGGDDLTEANGTYEVTSATASNPPATRVLKHSTASYYLVYVEPDEENYMPGGWCLASSASISDVYSAYLYTSATTLTAGTSTWSSEMGMNYDSVTVGSVSSTHHNPAIVVRAVTAYSAVNTQYTFDEETETLSAFEVEPVPHYIYAKSGTSLVGDAIGNEGGNCLLTHIPAHTSPMVSVYGNSRNNTYLYGLSAWSFPSLCVDGNEITGYTAATIDGVTCLYNSYSMETYTYEAENQTAGRLRKLPIINRHWSCSAAFHYGNQTSKIQRLLVFSCDNCGGKIALDIDWTAATPYLRIMHDDTVKAQTTASSALLSGWHHALMVYDIDTETLKLYLDGNLAATVSNFKYERTGYFDPCHFGIGRADDSYCIGYTCEIKLWSITLTSAMITAEYNRVSALWTN